jgi:hypothetical protein
MFHLFAGRILGEHYADVVAPDDTRHEVDFKFVTPEFLAIRLISQ